MPRKRLQLLKSKREKEAWVIQSLESLPFRKLYSLGDRIDLLLVYGGLKPATDITIGKDWEGGQ
ncbi:MAG: hypothetical protein A2939_05315 [Parcubacteria group bacterium RIFCSPLOWO2_01_FULL_48_18]|nr:MAG: hypothetical protein A3J67_06655 [Parcubacteria group bacterium RIFCSPHIGHO2_02_FULL_48_10b]OHB22518.1 MAG: hypothetical protein A2939_05315 [Parcubacteria group bacterium RIFCSPLOWO2_01_FULL_48_18]